MKQKIFLVVALAVVCLVTACTSSKKSLTLTVTNPLPMERKGEIVEIEMSDVASKLQLPDTAEIIVLDINGQQVPYQITYDQKVIFPVDVKANESASYTIQTGTPQPFAVKACGKHYPERMDDVAWENDLVAFRTYGPALQASGERAFGYDIWTKYKTTEPVVEERYQSELNPVTKTKIEELRKTDPKAADALYKSISYHVDHGNGLDCYKVGPTLGGGAAALMVGDTIIYPYCYRTQEILDNGPLRFTVKLVYNPLTVANDSNVVETRIITLDAGSYMNKTAVSYTNLKEAMSVATGIVLHEPNGTTAVQMDNGYMTYVDPTDNANNNNGKIFVGAAFPAQVNEMKSVLFSESEKKNLRGGADGHLLAISEYVPGTEYIYYWGSAWDKGNIKTVDAWNNYVNGFAKNLRNPLQITIK